MFRRLAEHVLMILSLFLSTAGIVLFAWAMLRLAVFALPVWLGLSVFLWSAMGATGVLVGLLLGLVVGVAAFVLGQLVIGSRLPILMRGCVAALFAVPAGNRRIQRGIGADDARRRERARDHHRRRDRRGGDRSGPAGQSGIARAAVLARSSTGYDRAENIGGPMTREAGRSAIVAALRRVRPA